MLVTPTDSFVEWAHMITGDNTLDVHGAEVEALKTLMASPSGTTAEQLWDEYLAGMGYTSGGLIDRYYQFIRGSMSFGDPFQGRIHIPLTGGVQPLWDETDTSTFTRASSATVINPRTGLLETYSTNEPRITDHGILLEPAATNSITRSNGFANWSTSGTPSGVQDQVGIDGKDNTAWTLTDDDGAAYESFFKGVTIPNDSNPHIVSIYVLKDNNEARFPEFQLRLTGGTAQYNHFQLNTKTGEAIVRTSVGTVGIGVEDVGLFWRVYGYVYNNTTGNTLATVNLFPAATTVFGSTEVSATGSTVMTAVQLELNQLYPSSYIETTTSAVSRAADSLDYTLGSWFSTTEGTLIADVYIPYLQASGNFPRILAVSSGVLANRVVLNYSGASQKLNIAVVNGGITQVSGAGTTTVPTGEMIRVGIAWKLNDFAVYMNGTQEYTSASGTLPTGLTKLYVGEKEDGTAAELLGGYIRRVLYTDTRILNADLAIATSL